MKLIEVSRGISHIEDVPIGEFIEILGNLSNFQITEKVDGAQILFGIDENGFYTSRETKGGVRIYNEEDYGITFSSTYMRSAHRLLEKELAILRGAGLRSGDQVEAEVLYGELPNVVPYSADINYLIFLRTTEGSVNIDRLQQKLSNHSTSVNLVAPYTDNGKEIYLREEANVWKFSRVPVIEKDIQNQKCRNMLSFLNAQDAFTGQTNRVVLETPLNKIPSWVPAGTWKDTKEYIKERRNLIQDELLREHVLPIKESLLNQLVRNTSSAFGPTVEDGGWIEGVVLRHMTTGKMIKLVDKSVFGTLREAAWAKRNMLTEAAKGTDGATSFMGKLLLDMSTSIGHPALGTIQAKRYLSKLGTTRSEIIENITEGLEFNSVRSYWESLLILRETELSNELDKYRTETMPVDIGNQLFEMAIKKRTLESFAQTFQRIRLFKESVAYAECAADLVDIIAGKQLGEI